LQLKSRTGAVGLLLAGRAAGGFFSRGGAAGSASCDGILLAGRQANRKSSRQASRQAAGLPGEEGSGVSGAGGAGDGRLLLVRQPADEQVQEGAAAVVWRLAADIEQQELRQADG
jgi:hypothetical protein